MKKAVVFTDSPYYACLDCSHRKAGRCNGPRTSKMTLLEWCKFMRAMKEANGLTNKEIEKKSKISQKTIEKIMALNTEQDIMRDTARKLENAIIGDSTQYPCYLAFEENVPEMSPRLSEAIRELERTLANSDEDHRKAIDNIHASHTAEVQAIKAKHIQEMQAVKDEDAVKIQYLQTLVERLQRENDNLWTENTRKSRIIDRLVEMQNAASSK